MSSASMASTVSGSGVMAPLQLAGAGVPVERPIVAPPGPYRKALIDGLRDSLWTGGDAVTTKPARILWVTLLVAACVGGAKPPAATPFVPEPTPTPAPWAIEVTSVKYDTKARVGGSLFVTAIITNTGKAENPELEFQFSDIEDYADIVGCTPKCSTHDNYAVFPGLAAGKTKTYEVEFIPTAVGAAHWDLCIYDKESFGEQVYCGEGTTTIR